MCTDASAAKCIAMREGLGKSRHVEVAQLWVQEEVRNGEVKMTKIKGTDNPADILTKHVSSEVLSRHLGRLGHRIRDDRHTEMPHTSHLN